MGVEIEGLSFSFTGEKPVLEGIDLSIEDGEFLALLGANGSGKTTLALSIAGLIPQFLTGEFSGFVKVNEKDSLESPIHEMARETGFLLQDYESQIFFHTLREELEFKLGNFGEALEKIGRIAKDLDVTSLLDKRFDSMSEGQKQKALIALALCLDQKLLILDEPNSQLDSTERKRLLKMLEGLRKSGKTIILITHDVRMAEHCSRFVFMKDGKIVRDKKDVSALRDPDLIELGIEPLGYKWGGVRGKKGGAEPVVEAKDLHYSYGEKEVLKGLNAEVAKGHCVLVMGGNGAGKTTFIKQLIKLLKPQKGRLAVLGKDINDYTQKEIASRVGFIFQNPEHQLFKPTVKEELEYSLEILGVNEDNAVKKSLEFLGLEDFSERNPQALSTGEKQRVALAATLVSDPDIAVLDEPMAYLDFNAKTALIGHLNRLKEKGKSMIIVTHHPEYYALADAEIRIGGMTGGGGK